MDDIEKEESKRQSRFQWILRLRPDMEWKCAMPASIDLWPAADVLFSHDFALLMRRAHVDTMRLNPEASVFWPCDPRLSIYAEYCQWANAMRDVGARVRWLSMVNIRRPCTLCHPAQNTSCNNPNNWITTDGNATFTPRHKVPLPTPNQTCSFSAMATPQQYRWVAEKIIVQLNDASKSAAAAVLRSSFAMGA